MQCKAAAALAAALAGALPVCAWADVSASLRLSDFGYRLVDLDPGDGIAPELRFEDRVFGMGVGVQTQEGLAPDGAGSSGGLAQTSRFWRSSGVRFGAIERAVTSPNGGASAQAGGSVDAHDYAVTLQGRTRNTLDDPEFTTTFRSEYFASTGRLQALPAMTLTPFTAVVWSGTLLVEAESTLPIRGNRFEQAGADALFELTDLATGTELDRFFGSIATRRYRADRESGSFDMALNWTNDRATSANAQLRINMFSWGESFVPVVPEPGTPWLLLCGAGVLAGALHRRRGHRA